MKFPTYTIFKDTDDKECILQFAFPHYIGEVIYQDGHNGWDSWGRVIGYKLTIMWRGSFHGNQVVFAPNMKSQLQNELDAMATWYLIEVIGKDLEKYSRFAL